MFKFVDWVVNNKRHRDIARAGKERHNETFGVGNRYCVYSGQVAPRHEIHLSEDTIELQVPRFAYEKFFQFPVRSLRQIKIYPDKDHSLSMIVRSDEDDDLSEGDQIDIKKIDRHAVHDFVSHLERIIEKMTDKHIVVEGRSYLTNPPKKPFFIKRVLDFLFNVAAYIITAFLLLILIFAVIRFFVGNG